MSRLSRKTPPPHVGGYAGPDFAIRPGGPEETKEACGIDATNVDSMNGGLCAYYGGLMRLLWLCMWVAWCGLGAQLLAPEQVELTPTNAVVHWVTDVPTATRVQVSPTSANVVVADGHHSTTNHIATISGLRPGLRYEVKVG